MGPHLFLVYMNDIWRNLESTIKLFADDCLIYRKIMNNSYTDMLQIDLDRLGECVGENAMKINPGKRKSVSFMRDRVKDPLTYFLGDQRIPEASDCKYLGITLRNV